ncbi:hypothetical protein QE390_004005 [Siphonobacter sp. SORGH_AS 1065]|nr:hypothetical protein [Siphonobacter sp. SORGH_AS_1065]
MKRQTPFYSKTQLYRVWLGDGNHWDSNKGGFYPDAMNSRLYYEYPSALIVVQMDMAGEDTSQGRRL